MVLGIMLISRAAAVQADGFGNQPGAAAESVVVWKSETGRAVRTRPPQLMLTNPKDKSPLPFKVELIKRTAVQGGSVLDYALTLQAQGLVIKGTANVRIGMSGDVLISRMTVTFDQPVTDNVETVWAFDVPGAPARQMELPERNGCFKIWPLSPELGGAGRFALGRAAQGPAACSALGMPVVGLIFGEHEPQLAVAADPYCGSYLQAQTNAAGTQVEVRTTYTGSLVPLRTEQRTVTLEFHRQGHAGTLRSFYRTIPEIKPGASWIQGIHLVYYDYLSEKGTGWFKDLQALADRIPQAQRGCVAACLHGWYDYFQHYAYDHTHRRLLKEWTAFPGTYKVPMSLVEMHRRLKFAKDLGFRVLLYFADGTNSDSGAPAFNPGYVLKDKAGHTFPGWKGPDSLGQPLKMDPSVPGLRDWYRDYLKALLDEYAREVDGLVWDETFYIQTDFISCTGPEPAYADRAMMSLVSELTQMVQACHDRNPELVFLASDNGETSYALVAHGTYQDSAMDERAWGPSMFANYRNCL